MSTLGHLAPGVTNGGVQSVAVAPIDNPTSSTKSISDPATVQKLIDEIQTAPILSDCSFGGNEEALLLHLKDGSLLKLSYWPAGQGPETQCVQLPPDFVNRLT